MQEQTFFCENTPNIFSPAAKQTLSNKIVEHFFSPTAKKGAAPKNEVRQAAPRLRLVVMKRKLRGKCAPANISSPVLRSAVIYPVQRSCPCRSFVTTQLVLNL